MRRIDPRLRDRAPAMTRHDYFASSLLEKYRPVVRRPPPGSQLVFRKNGEVKGQKAGGSTVVHVHVPPLPAAPPKARTVETRERVVQKDRIVEKTVVREKERVVERERVVNRYVFVVGEADRIAREQRLLRELAVRLPAEAFGEAERWELAASGPSPATEEGRLPDGLPGLPAEGERRLPNGPPRHSLHGRRTAEQPAPASVVHAPMRNAAPWPLTARRHPAPSGTRSAAGSAGSFRQSRLFAEAARFVATISGLAGAGGLSVRANPAGGRSGSGVAAGDSSVEASPARASGVLRLARWNRGAFAGPLTVHRIDRRTRGSEDSRPDGRVRGRDAQGSTAEATRREGAAETGGGKPPVAGASPASSVPLTEAKPTPLAPESVPPGSKQASSASGPASRTIGEAGPEARSEQPASADRRDRRSRGHASTASSTAEESAARIEEGTIRTEERASTDAEGDRFSDMRSPANTSSAARATDRETAEAAVPGKPVRSRLRRSETGEADPLGIGAKASRWLLLAGSPEERPTMRIDVPSPVRFVDRIVRRERPASLLAPGSGTSREDGSRLRGSDESRESAAASGNVAMPNRPLATRVPSEASGEGRARTDETSAESRALPSGSAAPRPSVRDSNGAAEERHRDGTWVSEHRAILIPKPSESDTRAGAAVRAPLPGASAPENRSPAANGKLPDNEDSGGESPARERPRLRPAPRRSFGAGGPERLKLAHRMIRQANRIPSELPAKPESPGDIGGIGGIAPSQSQPVQPTIGKAAVPIPGSIRLGASATPTNRDAARGGALGPEKAARVGRMTAAMAARREPTGRNAGMMRELPSALNRGSRLFAGEKLVFASRQMRREGGASGSAPSAPVPVTAEGGARLTADRLQTPPANVAAARDGARPAAAGGAAEPGRAETSDKVGASSGNRNVPASGGISPSVGGTAPDGSAAISAEANGADAPARGALVARSVAPMRLAFAARSLRGEGASMASLQRKERSGSPTAAPSAPSSRAHGAHGALAARSVAPTRLAFAARSLRGEGEGASMAPLQRKERGGTPASAPSASPARFAYAPRPPRKAGAAEPAGASLAASLAPNAPESGLASFAAPREAAAAARAASGAGLPDATPPALVRARPIASAAAAEPAASPGRAGGSGAARSPGLTAAQAHSLAAGRPLRSAIPAASTANARSAGPSPRRPLVARQSASAPSPAAVPTWAEGTHPAPAEMEWRRQERPPATQARPPEVVVDAPKEIDAEQLKQALSQMPQLNPDKLADQVYQALMKRFKLEQRLRGY